MQLDVQTSHPSRATCHFVFAVPQKMRDLVAQMVNHRGVDTAKMVLKCGGAYYLGNSTISYFVFLYHPILSLRSLTFVVNLFSLCHLFREPENYNSPNNISHLRTSACISYKWQSF